MKGLTIKQENFCNYYIESGNASDAYRRAYSCEKMKDETVNRKAIELLNNGMITARVKVLQEEQKEKSDITKERVLQELSGIAFSSIADMHNTWIERKEFEKLSRKEKSAIKSISTKIFKKNIGTSDEPEIVDVEYVKIELYDKIKAIERICKMLGFDSPTEMNINRTEEEMSREDMLDELERLEKLRKKKTGIGTSVAKNRCSQHVL